MVCGLSFRVRESWSKFEDLGFGDKGFGFRVSDFGLRAWSSRFRVYGLGFRV
jgi:hypothetical protein